MDGWQIELGRLTTPLQYPAVRSVAGDDLKIFMGLLADLFPSVEPVSQNREETMIGGSLMPQFPVVFGCFWMYPLVN